MDKYCQKYRKMKCVVLCGVCEVLSTTPHRCNIQRDSEIQGFSAVCCRKCKLCYFLK